MSAITVGVLALQGAFHEHIQLLRKAAAVLSPENPQKWRIIEVRTVEQLQTCDGLIIPGGESTAISLVAARSGMLDPLRDFVKYALPMSAAILYLVGCKARADDSCERTDSIASQRGEHVPVLFFSRSPQTGRSKVARS